MSRHKKPSWFYALRLRWYERAWMNLSFKFRARLYPLTGVCPCCHTRGYHKMSCYWRPR